MLFSGSPAGDPYRANVVLSLHAEGTDGSTSFIDSSPATRIITTLGNAQIDTAQARFGNSSILLDGSGDYLSVGASADAFYPSAGGFTVECESRQAAIGTTQRIVGFASVGGGDSTWVLSINSDNRYMFQGYDGTSYKTAFSTTLATVGVFNHVAGTVDGSYLKVWVNGVLEGTSAILQGPLRTPLVSNLSIGRMGDYDGQYYNGHLDELRITQGVARYAANFTRPSAAHPDF